MEEKTVKLAITPLLASCLQRLLVDEIDNQNKWKEQDKRNGLVSHLNVRVSIVNECKELIADLEKQGIHKYFKCY